MFMLTASIIGLQFAWGTEVKHLPSVTNLQLPADHRDHLVDLLHPIPPLSRHVQKPHEPRVDRWTTLWPDCAAVDRYDERQESEQIRAEEAFHACGQRRSRCVLCGARVGKGDCGVVRGRRGGCMVYSTMVWDGLRAIC